MADETQDCSTTEQVSISVRYVDVNYEICEDFLGFIKVKKMDAQTIANELLETLEKWGLDMASLVGQGYDGASVMSGFCYELKQEWSTGDGGSKIPECSLCTLSVTRIEFGYCWGLQRCKASSECVRQCREVDMVLGGSAKRKEIFLEMKIKSTGTE